MIFCTARAATEPGGFALRTQFISARLMTWCGASIATVSAAALLCAPPLHARESIVSGSRPDSADNQRDKVRELVERLEEQVSTQRAQLRQTEELLGRAKAVLKEMERHDLAEEAAKTKERDQRDFEKYMRKRGKPSETPRAPWDGFTYEWDEQTGRIRPAEPPSMSRRAPVPAPAPRTP